MVSFSVGFLSLTALLATSVTAQTYVACVGAPPTLAIPGPNSASSGECATACSGETYAYWRSSTGDCACSSVGPDTATLAAGPHTACSSGQWMAMDNPTTFNWWTCASSLAVSTSDVDATSTTTSGADTCFHECKAHLYAAAIPASGQAGSLYNCFCFNLAPASITTSGTCDVSTYYIWTHPPDAAASQLARRHKAHKKRIQEQLILANPHCPPGLQPCLVSDLADAGYECLDTLTELESCGGCRYGLHGGPVNATVYAATDCTSLHGADPRGASCVKGNCKITRCQKGFKLRKGLCV